MKWKHEELWDMQEKLEHFNVDTTVPGRLWLTFGTMMMMTVYEYACAENDDDDLSNGEMILHRVEGKGRVEQLEMDATVVDYLLWLVWRPFADAIVMAMIMGKSDITEQNYTHKADYDLCISRHMGK